MRPIVYIAAPFQHANVAEKLAQYLQMVGQSQPSKGALVISRWHRVPVGVMSLPEAFLTNMSDLQQSDFLIMLTYKDSGREVYTELGLSLARKKRVLWLPQEAGECLSLEQNPLVTRFETQEKLWEWFKMI